MAELFSAQIVGAETVSTRLIMAGPHVRDAVRGRVNRLGVALQRKAMDEKLKGQVLNVKTGRLRRSINLRVDDAGEDIRGSVGTNVVYGRRWELGGSWTESVRSYLRRNRASMAAAKAAGHRDGKSQNSARKVAARTLSLGASVVKAHDRRVNIQPRSFLRSSLDAMRGQIRSELLAAVAGGLKK